MSPINLRIQKARHMTYFLCFIHFVMSVSHHQFIKLNEPGVPEFEPYSDLVDAAFLNNRSDIMPS